MIIIIFIIIIACMWKIWWRQRQQDQKRVQRIRQKQLSSIEYLHTLYSDNIVWPKTFDNISLDIFENIEKKAIREAKNIRKQISQMDHTLMHIEIVDSTINFDKSIIPKHKRKGKTMKFINDVCRTYPRKINGSYDISLGDHHHLDNVFVFSKKRIKSSQVCIPDYYALSHYNGMLDVVDTKSLDEKKDKAIFIGSSTGNADPKLNKRLQLCEFAENNSDFDVYINNIVQIDKNHNSRYLACLHNSMSISQQRMYKYIIDIDGNTCGWDRLPWILNSNSIGIKNTSDSEMWYYEFLEKDKYFYTFDTNEELVKVIKEIRSTDLTVLLNLIDKAKKFAREYLSYEVQRLYMGHLLYYCGYS